MLVRWGGRRKVGPLVTPADYLAGLRELAALLKAQGEALRQGRWEAARRLQQLAVAQQERLSPTPVRDAGEQAAIERELRQLLAEVEAQLAALAVLREEAAAELGEISRWRRRLAAFRQASQVPAGPRLDLLG